MNLFNKSSKGFTLIELLVVVAIIGILAATILASLGSARQKARLARAQSEISSMRAAAELYYSTAGTYGAGTGGGSGLFSDTASGMARLVSSVTTAFPGAAGQVSSDGSQWGFSFSAGSPAVIYCADSNGYSGKSSTAPTSSAPLCTPIP